MAAEGRCIDFMFFGSSHSVAGSATEPLCYNVKVRLRIEKKDPPISSPNNATSSKLEKYLISDSQTKSQIKS